MRLTESSLRRLIRAILHEEIEGWKPPWAGGGSGSGGHGYDDRDAYGDSDYDDFMGGDGDDDGGDDGD